MAFSRVLGVGVNPVLNLFIAKGWIPNAAALQHDNAIATLLAGLPLPRIATDEALSLRPLISTGEQGRYFAVNTGINNFGGTGIGPAFEITKNATGWTAYANNSEKSTAVGETRTYVNRISTGNHISVWEPATF